VLNAASESAAGPFSARAKAPGIEPETTDRTTRALNGSPRVFTAHAAALFVILLSVL
jgi:hypothetical protein